MRHDKDATYCSASPARLTLVMVSTCKYDSGHGKYL